MAKPTINRLSNPICKTCLHFCPVFTEFIYASPFAKCAKFGEKHLVTGKIGYEYADMCRMDETKCGQDARKYDADPLYRLKIAKYYGILSAPFLLWGGAVFVWKH